MKKTILSLLTYLIIMPLSGMLPRPDFSGDLPQKKSRLNIKRAAIEQRDFQRRTEARRRQAQERNAQITQRRTQGEEVAARQASFLQKLNAAIGRTDIDSLLDRIDTGNVIQHNLENTPLGQELIRQLSELNLQEQTPEDAESTLSDLLKNVQLRDE